MSLKCNYKILPKYRLVVETFSGEVEDTDIISLKESVRNDDAFSFEYNVLDDISDTKFVTSKEHLERVLIWMKNNFSSKRKSAILTSTPNQVALIMLFDSMQKNELPMNIKVFSTLDAAVQWVDLSEEHTSEIEQVIKELKA